MCFKLCKTQEIEVDGKKIVIRRPNMKDLKQILNFVNSLIDEDLPLPHIKRKTLKEEKGRLKNVVKEIRAGRKHHLIAIYKGKVIGGVSVRKGKGKYLHTAVYGIVIRKGYRNLGLGKLLTKMIIDIAKKDKEIKIVTLNTFSVNKKAMRLYKKFGFKKIATLPKRFKHKGRYIDNIVMDLNLQK